MAAAISVYLARVQESGEDLPGPIKAVIEDALQLLETRGYEPAAAKRKAMRRLLFRRDRQRLRQSVEQPARSKSL